jgi:hypothetical protein
MRCKNVWFVLIGAALLALACSKKSEHLAPMPFSDDFERPSLGEFWQGAPSWRIVDGWVFSSGTRNQALWLKARLPDDVVIELDARSESPEGDLKFEIFTDGKNHASGYILIFGGWNNSISAIARLDEHGDDRQELRKKGLVKMGQTYHMKVVRKDKVIKWYVDGQLLLDYYDSEPLRGEGHDRFGFNDWETNLYFDNLRIRPAGPDDK